MKIRRVVVSVVMLLVLLGVLAVSAFAHHSTAMFDTSKEITIEGKVTEVDWANPHSLMFLDAKPTGQPDIPIKNWSVQLLSPSALVALGWQRDSIKVGDKIKVSGFQRKDGKPQIVFLDLTDEKGQHFATSTKQYDGYSKN